MRQFLCFVSIVWTASEMGSFSLKLALRSMSSSNLVAQWSLVTWFLGNIPNHSYSPWFAFCNGLKTKALLIETNMHAGPEYVL